MSEDWVYGEFAEYSSGDHTNENENTFRHAGEIMDSDLRSAMTKQKASYDRLVESGKLDPELPGRYYDLRCVDQLRRIEGTEVATRAIARDQPGTLRNMTGSPDARADLSGQEAIRSVLNLIKKPPTPMLYVAGNPGSGKSRFVSWLLQMWVDNVAPRGQVATNVRTLHPHADHTMDGDRVQHVTGYSDLKTFLEMDSARDVEQGNYTPKAIFIDEASSSLMGSGSTGYHVREKLGPLLFKIREHCGNDGLVVWVGHDRGDVHPIFRALAKYVEKTGKKTATVFNSVRNRKGVGKITELSGIPIGSWNFSEFEKPGFNLDESESGEITYSESDMERLVDVSTVIAARESGDTLQEITEEVDYSYEWVRTQVNDYEENGIDAISDL